jgi:hypothetical protein
MMYRYVYTCGGLRWEEMLRIGRKNIPNGSTSPLDPPNTHTFCLELNLADNLSFVNLFCTLNRIWIWVLRKIQSIQEMPLEKVILFDGHAHKFIPRRLWRTYMPELAHVGSSIDPLHRWCDRIRSPGVGYFT